jgi:hypothetical protein
MTKEMVLEIVQRLNDFDKLQLLSQYLDILYRTPVNNYNKVVDTPTTKTEWEKHAVSKYEMSSCEPIFA